MKSMGGYIVKKTILYATIATAAAIAAMAVIGCNNGWEEIEIDKRLVQ
jgi:hypothetical protein